MTGSFSACYKMLEGDDWIFHVINSYVTRPFFDHDVDQAFGRAPTFFAFLINEDLDV